MPVELHGSSWAKNSLLKKILNIGWFWITIKLMEGLYNHKISELLGIWIWIYVSIALELVSLATVSWVQVLLSDWAEAGHELVNASQLRFSDFWLWNLILVLVFHNAIGFYQSPKATIKCVGNLKILRCQLCMNLTRIGIGYCYRKN